MASSGTEWKPLLSGDVSGSEHITGFLAPMKCSLSGWLDAVPAMRLIASLAFCIVQYIQQVGFVVFWFSYNGLLFGSLAFLYPCFVLQLG